MPTRVATTASLNRYSAALALCADVFMGVLGGKLKFKEKLSARLGDVLSYLYIASAMLKRYEDNGRPEVGSADAGVGLPRVHVADADGAGRRDPQLPGAAGRVAAARAGVPVRPTRSAAVRSPRPSRGCAAHGAERGA